MMGEHTGNGKLAKLGAISLFKGLDINLADLGRIAELFETENFSAGHTVIAEGETGDKLYVIKKGTVEIQKRTMQGDTYTVTDLSAEMNVFFGEMALIDSDKRSATVVCKTDCEFYTLSRERFIALGDTHAALGLGITREISRILCGRLRKANSDIIILFDALVGEVAESGGMSE